MKREKLLLGKRIKFLRKQQNLTQEKFSEMIDRSPNHLSKIESGEANPPLSLLIDIAKNLDVELVELFDFNGNIVKNPVLVEEKNLSQIPDIAPEKVMRILQKIYKAIISESVK